MEHSIKTGLAFGLTSGIITTLGLLVGLHSGTRSNSIVIGGVITIAIADALSDALGIHISEESENVHTEAEIWVSTISTFASKFLCALSFLIPLLLLASNQAIWASIMWGMFMLSILSFWIAKSQQRKPLPIIAEHLAVAIAVIAITHYLGIWVSSLFG